MNSAIITGGAQGIGKAIAMKIMSQGVFVFILDNDPEALEDLENELPHPQLCKTIMCDIANDTQLGKTLEIITMQNPALRYLVNNAAISQFTPLEEMTLSDWNKVLSVNLTSYFLTAKYLSQSLKRNRGSIVNLCSTRAFMSEPHSEAYAATKGGVFSLTHALAMSLKPFVRVNSISPGWIDVTSWQKKSNRKKIHWDEKHHLQHPTGRIGEPEDVAEMAWFLLSNKSGFVTGQNFMVDGGMSRKMIYEHD